MALARRLMREPNVDVTVRAIAAGGSGVADLPDGRVVFVPRTAPGDRARIRIETSKARWAVGSLRRIIEPGPDRRDALCALYSECGGCQLQHVSYEKQLRVEGTLRCRRAQPYRPPRRDRFPEVVPSARHHRIPEPRNVHAPAAPWRACRRGLPRARSSRARHRCSDECVLPEPRLVDVWTRLREGWGQAARLLPAGGRLRLTLRAVLPGTELLVEGGEAGWSAAELVARVPALVAVHHRSSTVGAEATLVYGPMETGLGTAFLQVNARSPTP